MSKDDRRRYKREKEVKSTKRNKGIKKGIKGI
jgi:hypothetical protein